MKNRKITLKIFVFFIVLALMLSTIFAEVNVADKISQEAGSLDQTITDQILRNIESKHGEDITDTAERQTYDNSEDSVVSEGESTYHRLIVKYKKNESIEGTNQKHIDIEPHIKNKYGKKILNIKEEKFTKHHSVLTIEASINSEDLITELNQAVKNSNIEYIQRDYILTLETVTDYVYGDSIQKPVISHIYDTNNQETVTEHVYRDNVQGTDEAEDNPGAEEEILSINETGNPVNSINIMIGDILVTQEQFDILKALPEITIEGAEHILERRIMPHELDELKRLVEKRPPVIVVKGPPIETINADNQSAYKNTIGTNAAKTWKAALAGGATIAIIDIGIDNINEDIIKSLWINKNEIPDNGIDDDENGYTDDISGWNFADNTNDISGMENKKQIGQKNFVTDNIEASEDNKMDAKKTESRAKLMILEVFKDKKAYTSHVIEAINYAEIMGAKILNIDLEVPYENRAMEEAISASNMLFTSIEAAQALSIIMNGELALPSIGQPNKSIAAGIYHTLKIGRDGTVWSWGSNGAGQLGDGTRIDKSTPVKVSGLRDVIEVAAGGSYSMALKRDGTVWSWGSNGDGQLGDGTKINRSTPVKVSGLTGITAIAAGYSHSMALKNDKTVWAWGNNGYGQLGDGTTIDKSVPVNVSGLTELTAIEAGDGYCIALKSDETVWSWGDNDFGQLGDGTRVSKSTPVQVSKLKGIKIIAAGGSHNIAVGFDRTVWFWGDCGQHIMRGTNVTENAPSAIIIPNPNIPSSAFTMGGIIGAEAGYDYSMVLKSDGTVWSWGDNQYGQLGDGTKIYKKFTVKVSGITEIKEIAAGYYHGIAFKNDGTLWAWGDNYYGQLGDGKKIASTSIPILILSDYSISYTYDANNRLITETRTNGTNKTIIRYFYDGNGNLISNVTD